MIPLNYFILVAALFFALGIYGMIKERNLLKIFMSSEITLASVNIIALVFARIQANTLGQVFVLFIWGISVANLIIALALFLYIFRRFKTIDLDKFTKLRF